MTRFAIAAALTLACTAPQATDAASDAGVDAAPLDSATPEAGIDAAPPAAAPIDRMGRPAINTALNDRALKDPYNRESTYASPLPTTYDSSFERHLEALDKLAIDGTNPDRVDWPPVNGAHPLRDALKLDVLLVDTGKPCSAGAAFAPSYLEIETEVLLGGPPHTTCGGRTPNDDVVDTTLTLLVTRGRAGVSPVSDGVSAATKPANTKFPYLAAPN